MEAVSFDLYDKNGKEIENAIIFNFTDEITFKGAKLRPEGKNEGTLYIAIPKGEVPTEVIFKSNWNNRKLGNEYIIKLG